MITYIILGLVLLSLVFGVLINNSLIAKRNRADQAYGSIEVYLKKRFDLIPNLVATVNKYTQHERELLTEITQLRSAVGQAEKPSDTIETENKITGLLRKIQIQVENYPDLKADRQFMQLQWALSDLEDQLSAARRAFNAAVTDYNNAIQMFPNSMIAGVKNFQAKALLHIPEKEQQYVSVDALFKA